jgi:hypothetical protein
MLNNNLRAINDAISSTDLTEDEIPLKDKFFMSDLEKYYKYGTIPYILFIQIFLLISTTTIVKLLI